MRQKIAEFIIHLFGGVTEYEAEKEARRRRYKALHNARTYLDIMNGAPADVWCKNAYKYIERLESEALFMYNNIV